MRDSYPIDTAVANQRTEKSIPQAARGVLQVPTLGARNGSNVFAARKKRQIMVAGQGCDEMLILLRIHPAQTMIEVQHDEPDPHLLAQFPQKPKQRHRVGAAGNTYTYTIAGAQHLVARDRSQNPMGEVNWHGKGPQTQP
jgi:hypothetical protein